MRFELADVIRQPIVSEESYLETEMGKYRFMVASYANKLTVRKAVEKMFDVNVVDVNIQNVRGKVKRRGRYTYKRSDWKKAIVTLRDGQSLDFVEKFGDKG